MAAPVTTGRPRKQLADQLDRLDGIIDALAEGLNQAVADAAREGTRLAVTDAIVELATNPELRALFAPPVPAPGAPTPCVRAAPGSAEPGAPAVPPEPKRGLWSRIGAAAAAARAACAAATGRARDAVARRWDPLAAAAAAIGRLAGAQLPARRAALVGLAAGAAVTAACLLVPHSVAAVIGGVGASATAVAVQTGHWLLRAARSVGLLT